MVNDACNHSKTDRKRKFAETSRLLSIPVSVFGMESLSLTQTKHLWSWYHSFFMPLPSHSVVRLFSASCLSSICSVYQRPRLMKELTWLDQNFGVFIFSRFLLPSSTAASTRIKTVSMSLMAQS